MRITGGKLCSLIVSCPSGIIRPSMDRMRESVFASLPYLEGKSFLDLFSGSAVIALEALSRGAASVELCEKDKGKAGVILENIAPCEEKMGVKIRCHFMSAEYFVKRCKRKFDYIFLDPPFNYGFHEDIVSSVSRRKLLEEDGLLMIHYPKEVILPEVIGDFKRKERKIYGRSVVDFFTVSR